MRWGKTFALSFMTVLAIAPSTHAQIVATVQNIQSAPLTIDAPYTTFSSAQPAVVTLQINEAAALSISAPMPTEFSDPDGTQHVSSLSYNNSTVTHGSPLNVSTIGTIDVEIEMQVTRPEPYPANAYTYSVLLTIVPQ